MFEIRRSRHVESVQRMAIIGIVMLCLVLVPATRADDYIGDGQSPEVNLFLNPEVLIVRDSFGNTLVTVPITQKVNMVPQGQGGSVAELQFAFGGSGDFTTFTTSIGTITDPLGNVLCWSSSGIVGFKGSRKGTPFAAQLAAEDSARKAAAHGMKSVDVFVSGPGQGRETAIRSLFLNGLQVKTISDVTPVAHNGCKPPKKRRV